MVERVRFHVRVGEGVVESEAGDPPDLGADYSDEEGDEGDHKIPVVGTKTQHQPQDGAMRPICPRARVYKVRLIG